MHGHRAVLVPIHHPGPGVAMFLPLLSAFAVGMSVIVAIFAIAIPFILGFFGRRDTH